MLTEWKNNSLSCMTVMLVMFVVAFILDTHFVEAVKAPECTKSCVDLAGVTQEVHIVVTDEGQQCSLDPIYRECIIKECKTPGLPKEMIEFMKVEYNCDLSSGGVARDVNCVLAIGMALLCLLLGR